jgi:hypothetical protein
MLARMVRGLGQRLTAIHDENLTTLIDLGPIPVRREIRSLQKDFPDQWNLYLLGLKDFQEVDENDPLSYYQIAGKASCHVWLNDIGMDHLTDVGMARDSWSPVQGMEWRGGRSSVGLLHPLFHPFPHLASSLLGSLRSKSSSPACPSVRLAVSPPQCDQEES